jgi:hypothetical protein
LEGHLPRDPPILTKNPTYENQTFQAIEERYRASEFRWYFFDYLEKTCPTLYDRFDEVNTILEVWRSFKMPIPQIRDVSAGRAFHTIFASPSYLRENHLTSVAVPDRFDTAFVYCDTTAGHGSDGFQNRKS